MKFYDPKDFDYLIDRSIAKNMPVDQAYNRCKNEAAKWNNGVYRVCSFDDFAVYYMLRKGQIKQEGKDGL